MNPATFPQANTKFGPPTDLAESQCLTIPAYMGRVQGGSVDGSTIVVVAWLPTAEELKQLNAGAPIYLSCMGGLPPHFISTDFDLATHPA